MLEGLARKNRRIYIKIKEKDRLIGRACNRKHLNKSSKKKKKKKPQANKKQLYRRDKYQIGKEALFLLVMFWNF